MIRPPALQKGDKIAIVSPARSITFAEVHPAMRFFQRHGFEVILGSHVFDRHHQFAGSDENRRRDFQQMLDDDAIRAIVCARGGYGTVRIVDGLDFTQFRRFPKWIVGYSDVTVLHSHIQRNLGMETLHAVMPVNISDETREETLLTLVHAMLGKQIRYAFPSTGPIRAGRAEGEVVGGNLSILYSLAGSRSEPDYSGKLLFIEDVDEYLYHIDRMIVSLKRSGAFSRIAGLIVGGMTRMNDNAVPFGMNAEEIIAAAAKDFPWPMCFGFPAGHDDPNVALFLGRRARLTVGATTELAFL